MCVPLGLLRPLSIWLVMLCGVSLAQTSPSIETLGAPGETSTGESLPLDESAPAEIAAPLPCGSAPISIAAMQWPSSEILAAVHAQIIAEVFGCDVEIVQGDLGATAASMGATGQPAVAPELWISRVADVWNQAVKAQRVRQAGLSFAEPTLEGWFIPDYVAAAHPELTSADKLADNWLAFAGEGSKGRFISCPIDWGCSVINKNLLRALGLSELFDVVEPANRFAMDTQIAEAVSRKEPVLFYYWQPNAVLAQFEFKPLALGAYDRDAFMCLGRRVCETPLPSAFAPEPVIIALADWVFTDAPEVAAYFQRARMPIEDMNVMLAGLSEPGATAKSVAQDFVAERGEVWRPWAGLPTAAQ